MSYSPISLPSQSKRDLIVNLDPSTTPFDPARNFQVFAATGLLNSESGWNAGIPDVYLLAVIFFPTLLFAISFLFICLIDRELREMCKFWKKKPVEKNGMSVEVAGAVFSDDERDLEKGVVFEDDKGKVGTKEKVLASEGWVLVEPRVEIERSMEQDWEINSSNDRREGCMVDLR